MNSYRRSILSFLLAALVHLYAVAQQPRHTLLFNQDWKFFKGDVRNGQSDTTSDKSWRLLDLPHDWSIEGPFDEKWASATGYLPGGIGWYRKTFRLTSEQRTKKIFIYFDGAYKNTEVWINGHFLGKRPNGFIPFQYELTDHLNKSGENVIAVRCDHTEFADSRWYTGSGIYRNVYLVTTNPVHIDLWGVRFTTPRVSTMSASARVEVAVINSSSVSSNAEVEVQLVNTDKKIVAAARKQMRIHAGDTAQSFLSFDVRNPALWSPGNPQLYTLNVAVLSNGKKVDEIKDEVGFRFFHFDPEKGFFLNGSKMKLKGVCLHDDAGSLGVAVPEAVWKRRLKLLKEAGCNSIRMSHNPHADYLYRLMDRMGFLVQDEAFDEWELGKNKWIKGWNVGQPGKDGYHTHFREWADRDVRDMVLRNFNRPSIIMWSIGNEIDYPNDPYSHEVLNTGRNPQIYGRGYMPSYPNASRLGELARHLAGVIKKYDTSRPVTAALAGVVMSNEVGYPDALDIVGYNYQEYRYPEDHQKYPDRVIYGSENGHQLANWKAVAENDFISAQYLWTGIDYLGEARTWPSRSNGAGLIDLAGFPKSEYFFRKSIWTSQPMIYVGTSRTRGGNFRNLLPTWNYAAEDSVRISCFTNVEEAELLINGTSLGRKKRAESSNNIITWATKFSAGELMVKGYQNGREVNRYLVKTASKPETIKAEIDSTILNTGGVAHIEISLRDKDGNQVFQTENEITVTVSGTARLLGLESGNHNSRENYQANARKLFSGRLVAYVQAGKNAGKVTVRISSPGLREETVTLSTISSIKK